MCNATLWPTPTYPHKTIHVICPHLPACASIECDAWMRWSSKHLLGWKAIYTNESIMQQFDSCFLYTQDLWEMLFWHCYIWGLCWMGELGAFSVCEVYPSNCNNLGLNDPICFHLEDSMYMNSNLGRFFFNNISSSF